MSVRIEFSEATKHIVAQRAAYKCSIPTCEISTIGPGQHSHEVISTGVAAHIFSASPHGPRESANLPKEEIKSAANCIWLCANHARIVDANRGTDFPSATLLGYKALREARAARELTGLRSKFGWLHELAVIKSPVFQPSSKVRFGKATLIFGDNGSGKTAIAEFLSGTADPERLMRWSSGLTDDCLPRVILRTTYFNPEEQSLSLECGPSGQIRFHLNENLVPFDPYPIRSIYLPHYESLNAWEMLDDINAISAVLGTHSAILENLLSRVPVLGVCIEKLSIEPERGYRTLNCKLHHHKFTLSFRQLSSSEKASVLVELSAAIADFWSKYEPTLLILDGGVQSLDDKNLANHAAALSVTDRAFQSLILVPTANRDFSEIEWQGWQIIQLRGTGRNVSVAYPE